MNKKTRRLTLSALFSALAFAFLYFSSIWPTGQPGLVAAASLFVAAAVVEAGPVYGLYVFLVSSALSLVFTPNRLPTLLYISFFGHYPIIKSLIERLRMVWLQWALKLMVFNLSLTACWYALKELVYDFRGVNVHIALIYLSGSLLFALFDYGFTKVICFYLNRVPRRGGENK